MQGGSTVKSSAGTVWSDVNKGVTVDVMCKQIAS